MVAGSELSYSSGGKLDDENMEAPVIIEAAHSLIGVRFIKVAGDHDGITRRVLGFRSRHRRYTGTLFAVRRPGDGPAGRRKLTVGSFPGSKAFRPQAVRACHDQSGLVSHAATVGDPTSDGRPFWSGRSLFFASDADRFMVGQCHDPHLRIRPACSIVIAHRVGDAGTVG